MTFPTCAEIAGVQYPINTDYRIGLKCLAIADDPNITDEERALAIIYLLFGFVPDGHYEDFIRIASLYLSCGEEQSRHQARQKDMDFQQDEKYIAASFMSDYHIDLSKTDMHFWQYYTLLSGLTEYCVLSRVRELRTYDISDIKDAKSRRRILDAQQAVALKYVPTAEEQREIDEFESLFTEGGEP